MPFFLWTILRPVRPKSGKCQARARRCKKRKERIVMLHTFKCLDRFLLLDIESGAVHVVDEITHDVAKLYEDHDRSE